MSENVADFEKSQAVKEKRGRFDKIDHATADQLKFLGEQQSKQADTLTAVYANLLSEMPVTPVFMRWDLAPTSLEAVRRVIRFHFPKADESDNGGFRSPRVMYPYTMRAPLGQPPKATVGLLVNREFEDLALKNERFKEFITQLEIAAGVVSIQSDAANFPIGGPGAAADSTASFMLEGKSIELTIRPRMVSANIFYKRPVYIMAPFDEEGENLPHFSM